MLQINGELTFNENMCDVEAVDIASHYVQHDVHNTLPNVSYTAQQTFFLNLAQVQ